MLIHASAGRQTKKENLFFEKAEYFRRYIKDMDLLPYGSLIAQVNLTEIYRTEWLLQNLEISAAHNWQQEFAFDDYSPNRYLWKFESVSKLDFFLPMKGTLGLWEYNGQV